MLKHFLPYLPAKFKLKYNHFSELESNPHPSCLHSVPLRHNGLFSCKYFNLKQGSAWLSWRLSVMERSHADDGASRGGVRHFILKFTYKMTSKLLFYRKYWDVFLCCVLVKMLGSKNSHATICFLVQPNKLIRSKNSLKYGNIMLK